MKSILALALLAFATASQAQEFPPAQQLKVSPEGVALARAVLGVVAQADFDHFRELAVLGPLCHPSKVKIKETLETTLAVCNGRAEIAKFKIIEAPTGTTTPKFSLEILPILVRGPNTKPAPNSRSEQQLTQAQLILSQVIADAALAHDAKLLQLAHFGELGSATQAISRQIQVFNVIVTRKALPRGVAFTSRIVKNVSTGRVTVSPPQGLQPAVR